MRKPLSIFLLFLFLFATLVPGQTQEELTRMPMLWKHFVQHREATATTFFQYLELHYGSGFAKHKPAHDHSKLPMKSGENHLHAPVPADLPKLSINHFQQNFLDKTAPFYAGPTYTFLLFAEIWQPPRNC